MRGARVASIVLVGALALTGCGGDGDDEAADATTTTVEEDSGSEGGSGGGSEDEGSGSGAGSGAITSERCAEAVQAMSAAASAVPQSLTGEAGDFDESLDQLEAFADAAPDEIRDDMQVIAEAYARVAEALEDAGIDPDSGEPPSPERIAELQEIAEELDDEELQEASERVNTWFEEECGQE